MKPLCIEVYLFYLSDEKTSFVAWLLQWQGSTYPTLWFAFKGDSLTMPDDTYTTLQLTWITDNYLLQGVAIFNGKLPFEALYRCTPVSKVKLNIWVGTDTCSAEHPVGVTFTLCMSMPILYSISYYQYEQQEHSNIFFISVEMYSWSHRSFLFFGAGV